MRQSLQRHRPYHETRQPRGDVWEADRFSHSERMQRRRLFAETRGKWLLADFDGRAWIVFQVVVWAIFVILAVLGGTVMIVGAVAMVTGG